MILVTGKTIGYLSTLTTVKCIVGSLGCIRVFGEMATVSDAEELVARVQKIYAQVKRERQQRKYEKLQCFLEEAWEIKTASVRQGSSNDGPIEPLVSTTDGSMGPCFRVRQQNAGATLNSSVDRIPLPFAGEPLPHHLCYVPIQSNYFMPDCEKLTSVPYLGEDNKSGDAAHLLSEHDISFRSALVENGPLYLEEESDALIDETLKQCSEIPCGKENSLWEHDETKGIVLGALSRVSHKPESRINDRLERMLVSKGQKTDAVARMPTELVSDTPEDVVETRQESLESNDGEVEYLKTVDSYRALFCPRCFTFNCNLHGLSKKPTLKFQTDRAREKEDSGTWTSVGNDFLTKSGSDPDERLGEIVELSSFHKAMCKRLFLVFEGDIDRMSITMRAPKNLIRAYIERQGFVLPPKRRVLLPTKRKDPYYSIKNYNQKWYGSIKDSEIHPLFVPCVHEGPCSEESCSCVKNNLFCTTACCWGSASPNFFRGCGCKGGCRQRSCTCFSNERECDPDLCSCETCCDPEDRPARKQRCRNDNLRMRRRAHVVIGPSTVSGWGLFARHDIKKGDFIHEYVGEAISQNEAERRGQIDDDKNRSYLFNLSSDYSIDGARRGGKARFINHSSSPNCVTRILFVNGEQRIGVFAKEDITAESELFFHYRYNENDLISKPAKSFPWLEHEDKKPAKKKTRRSQNRKMRK